MNVYRLSESRQGHYGVPYSGLAYTTIQLNESHGEAFLSFQHGIPTGEPVLVLPDPVTAEELFDILAELEDWGETWKEQCARIRREYPDEEEDTLPPMTYPRDPWLPPWVS